MIDELKLTLEELKNIKTDRQGYAFLGDLIGRQMLKINECVRKLNTLEEKECKCSEQTVSNVNVVFCHRCKKLLTNQEIKYYENTCTDCEGKYMEEIRKENNNQSEQPIDEMIKEAREFYKTTYNDRREGYVKVLNDKHENIITEFQKIIKEKSEFENTLMNESCSYQKERDELKRCLEHCNGLLNKRKDEVFDLAQQLE
jgi:hypothetical protein